MKSFLFVLGSLFMASVCLGQKKMATFKKSDADYIIKNGITLVEPEGGFDDFQKALTEFWTICKVNGTIPEASLKKAKKENKETVYVSLTTYTTKISNGGGTTYITADVILFECKGIGLKAIQSYPASSAAIYGDTQGARFAVQICNALVAQGADSDISGFGDFRKQLEAKKMLEQGTLLVHDAMYAPYISQDEFRGLYSRECQFVNKEDWNSTLIEFEENNGIVPIVCSSAKNGAVFNYIYFFNITSREIVYIYAPKLIVATEGSKTINATNFNNKILKKIAAK